MAELDYLFSGFRNAPREIHRILKSIPDYYEEKLRKDGEWNAHQILAHLRDVNREVYIPRLEQIVEFSNPVFQEFDGEQWMRDHFDPSESLKDVLKEFTQQCEETADWLENLPDEDWGRPGTHVSLGTHDLKWWAIRMEAHIDEHLSQLRGE
jgi:DinB superfamily